MSEGYAAYAQVHKRALTGRSLEAEAFMKSVQMLRSAQSQPGNNRVLAEALNYTRKLWTILQADLSSKKNKLDKKLKADLLSLSIFVDRQCVQIVENPRHADLQRLIEINQNIASGLMN